MPKLKTRKSVAKRFKFSARGKIKYKCAFGSHILSKKSARRKRRLKQAAFVSAVDTNKIRKLLPYG